VNYSKATIGVVAVYEDTYVCRTCLPWVAR